MPTDPLAPIKEIAKQHYKAAQKKKRKKPRKAPLKLEPTEDIKDALSLSDEELAAVYDEVVLEREIGRRSMREYAKMCWSRIEPGIEYRTEAWHSDCLSDHFQAVVDGDIKKLLISIPPGHGKSTWANIFFPTYAWIQQPWLKMAFGSYGYDLAQRDAEKCLRLIKSPWWQKRWGDRFDITKGTFKKITNSMGGIRSLSSIRGQTLGIRADIVVADDPLNILEIDSEVARKNVQQWWTHGMKSRGDAKQKEVVIMQRLHDDDLIGYLIEEVGGYEVLRLPAEYIPERRCKTFTLDGDLFWQDPREEEGELLFPGTEEDPRFNEDFLDEQKRNKDVSENLYSAMFQQEPVQPGGNIIKTKWFRYYQCTPEEQYAKCHRAILSCDPAVKAKDTSTYTVIQIWAVDGPNIYLIDQYRHRLSFTGILEGLTMMIDKWNQADGPGITAKLIEDKATGPAIIETLTGKFPGMIAFPADDDKLDRMEAITWLWQAGNVHVPGRPAKEGEKKVDFSHVPWMIDWYEEITRFPKARFTDQAITMSQALMHIGQSMKNLIGFPTTVPGRAHISDLRERTKRTVI